MLSLAEAIESGAVGLFLSVSGTYWFSRHRGAEALDEEHLKTIENLNHLIPVISPTEAKRRERVRHLLGKASDKEIDLLRFLSERDEEAYSNLYDRFGPEVVTGTHRSLCPDLIHIRTVKGNHAFWSIVPGLKTALLAVFDET